MADFVYRGTVNGSEPSEEQFNVEAGVAGSIVIGDLVLVANGYAAKVADGGCDAAGIFGLAISNSTDTVGAAGTVKVKYSVDGLIVRGTSTGTITAAEVFDRVTLDVSGGGVQTVDEDDPNGVLTIKGYTGQIVDVVITATL